MDKKTTSKKVLVVSAHPDDEVLGCGGTILKHVSRNDQVVLLTLSNGVSSRNLSNSVLEKEIQLRKQALVQACTILGIDKYLQLDFPDNSFDSVSLIEIIQAIEKLIAEFQPTIVYTHFCGDLNVDHQLTHKAVITACRTQPKSCVKEIYSYEVLSATNYISASMQPQFCPNYYVDISSYIDKKITALKAYDMEMRTFPHARSYEAIKALSIFRGTSVGLMAAEAFVVEKIID